MLRDRLWTYMVMAGVLAVAGWIWALSDAGMPDILWILTVVLSAIAIVLAVYAIVTSRRTGPRRY